MNNGETLPTRANVYPVALPHSIAAILKKKTEWPTQAEMLAIRDWFADYFTRTFRTFDRKTVGRKISPADELMQTAFAFLHIIAPCLPKGERELVFSPLNVLLRAIADRWEDTAAYALGAVQHLHELENVVMLKTDHVYQWAKSGETRMNEDLRKRSQRVLDEYANERQELKKELGKLSAQLLEANPNELKETLAQMKADICAAVADEGEKTRGEITDGVKAIRKESRGLIHKKFEQLKAEDERHRQLVRSANWLIDEAAEGRIHSIPEAAAQFGNEIEAEYEKGGYKNVETLRKELYENANILGIARFKKQH